MAISIDYIDPTAVSISVLLTHTFGLGAQHFHKASQVTVDHGTVRMIATSFEPYHYYLLSVSLAGEESVIENILPEVRAITYASGLYLWPEAETYRSFAAFLWRGDRRLYAAYILRRVLTSCDTCNVMRILRTFQRAPWTPVPATAQSNSNSRTNQHR